MPKREIICFSTFIIFAVVLMLNTLYYKEYFMKSPYQKREYVRPYSLDIKIKNKNNLASYRYPNITRIIHQSWKTKTISKIFQRYVPSWKKCFPEYKYKLWTDEDNRNLISKYYPWFLPKYDNLPAPIYKADCARYFYMFRYGGIYSDLDNECLFPFEHLLTNYSIVFGAIENVDRKSPLNNIYVQNSFMYSRPNHPFWLDLLLEIYHSKITPRPDISTGPEVLANIIYRYISKYNGVSEIFIYEGKYFNPLTWGDTSKNPPFCKPFDAMNDTEYKECNRYYREQGSYVVQYHTHIWG